jgi:anti-sigma factor ChrR (cupin superfamily)
MKEFSMNHEEMPWEEAKGYPTGTKTKILREEGDKRTFLLKLPKGFNMEAHCHTAVTEQHLVLEGSYRSEGKTHHGGSYRFIPREVTHGSFTSEDGAVVLVIWDS